MRAKALGAAELAKEVIKGSHRAIANPRDEDDFIAATVKECDAKELRSNPARVQNMARGFLQRDIGSTPMD